MAVKPMDSKMAANMGAVSLHDHKELSEHIYSEFKKSTKVTNLKATLKEVNKMKKLYNKAMGENKTKDSIPMRLENMYAKEFGEGWFNQAKNSVATLRRSVNDTKINTVTRIEKLNNLIVLAEKIKNSRNFETNGDMDSVIRKMKEWSADLNKGLSEFNSGSRKSSSTKDDGALLKSRVELLNKYVGFVLGEALDSAILEDLLDDSINSSVQIVGNNREVTYRVTKTGRKEIAGYKNQVGDIQVTKKVGKKVISFLISDKMYALNRLYEVHTNHEPEVAIQSNVKIARILAIMKNKNYNRRVENYMSAAFNYNRYGDESFIKKSYAGKNLEKPDFYLKGLSNMIWMIIFQDAFGLKGSTKKLVAALIISKKMYSLDEIIPKTIEEVANQSNDTVFKKGSSLSSVPYTKERTYYNSPSSKYLLKYLDLKTTTKMKSRFLNFK